jgi:hypothetical protein
MSGKRWMVGLAGVVLGLQLVSGSAAAQDAPPATGVPNARKVCGQDGNIGKLTMSPDDQLVVAFGRSRGERDIEIRLTVEGCELPSGQDVAIESTRLRRNDGVQLKRTQVLFTGVTKRHAIDVTMTVKSADIDPGEYKGAISIEEDRFGGFAAPASATLQYQPDWRLALVVLLSLGLGFGAVALTHGELLTGGWRSVAKTVPAVLFAGQVFRAKYLQNAVWGANLDGDMVALGSAVFTAFTGTFTGVAGFGAILASGPTKATPEVPAADAPAAPPEPRRRGRLEAEPEPVAEADDDTHPQPDEG